MLTLFHQKVRNQKINQVIMMDQTATQKQHIFNLKKLDLNINDF